MKNELQTESLRQLLLAQKVQLIDRLKQASGGADSRAEGAAQFAPAEQSHAQNMTERDAAFAMQEHEIEALESLEMALQKIARGEYGLCQACGTEIPITRLLAFPAALRCIACQTKAEQTSGPGASLR